MWLIPLLFIGVAIYAAGRERGASAPPSHRALPPPGPISVLGEFVRIGQIPPPPVILCAIAEAESIGRCDLATDIIRVFVAPVVYAQQSQLHARHPRLALRASPIVQERVYAPSFRVAKRQDSYGRGSCDRPRQPHHSPREAPPGPPSPGSLTDDQIRAALDADPERFIRDVAAHAHNVMTDPNWSTNPATAHLADRPVTMPEVIDTIARVAMTEAARDAQQVPEAPVNDSPYDEPATASPLLGVSGDAWSNFCGKLVRETPTYQSARHVGQYRQRRDRLAELGIDADSIIGSTGMQRAALDADLADAYRHAADDMSGIVRDNVNRKIVLNHGEPTTITLSGVLGVIQAAGLEGAVGWLEDPRDRKKFPHTTQAFVRCNGVF